MNTGPREQDEAYQAHILQYVSRTFALTIPQLPDQLARVVGNAYLLCRIADTIEDDADLPFEEKRAFSDTFIRVVRGDEDAENFANGLHRRLSPSATDAEHDLIAHTAQVIQITQSCNETQRKSMERCVRIMAEGMVHYQGKETLDGVDDQAAMDHYCYYVAGVVGEMLTQLFCDYSAEIRSHDEELMELAVSFGQGLQMTNILKDIWEDRARGACWLPRDIFQRRGINLSQVEPGANPEGFADCIGHLIGIAHGHLHNALRYTLLIPAHETQIREFCLWALGMAVLTLRKLNRQRDFTQGNQVKISRTAVKSTGLCTKLAVRSDTLLKILFRSASFNLPSTTVAPIPTPLPVRSEPPSL